ncbi:MAG: DUF2970 domain-containing protein, partial [Pseudomonadota bacterium]|nr:DUF2970 domain-containing protein [Pseudomonadota bacterium]
MSSKFTQILQIAEAEAFGVQSQRNRAKDFGEGNAGWFILAGIIFTVVFVFTVLTAVNLAV